MMEIVMEQLAWTRFADVHAYSKVDLTHSWADLIEHIRHAGPYRSKHACPLLKLAQFGAQRTTKGSYRDDDNIISICGIEGDYDGQQISPHEAISRLEKAGIKACVYTSPTHREEAPRWRVICPLSAPTTPANRVIFAARLNGALGGILAGESFTLSQSYFYGRILGSDSYVVLATFDDPDEGYCIDELSDLDAIAIKPDKRTQASGTGGDIAERVAALGRRLKTGDGRRELLKSYIGKKLQMGLDPDEVKTLVENAELRFFDPADPIDWRDVKGIISDFHAADVAEAHRVDAVVGEFARTLEQRLPQVFPGRFKLQRSDLRFDHLHPIKWILQGFVAAGEIVCFAGQPGVGKSTTFAGVALVVAGFGHAIGSDIQNDRPRRVLIVTEHAHQYARLFYAYIEHFKLDAQAVMDRVMLFDSARMTVQEIKAEMLHILGQAEDQEPPLVVLDTASACVSLDEENSNSEVGAVIAQINTVIRQTESPIWIITHAAKAVGREDSEITPRGASAWIGDVQGTGSVFRDKNFPNSIFVKSLKNRAVPEYREIEIMTELVRYEVADERGVIQSIGVRIGVPKVSGEGQRESTAAKVKAAEKAAHDFARDVDRRAKVQAAIDAGMPSVRKAHDWIKENMGGMSYPACAALFSAMKRGV